jgi:SAM-dependent methyltransferase
MQGPPSPADEGPPEPVLALLPDGSSAGGPGLDFDRALEGITAPPLAFPDESFDLIWSLSSFTRIADGWAEWLLDARRLLTEGGILVVGLADGETFERLTGEVWSESRAGMTVLSGMNGAGSRVVFHSEWWLRAHWGRAFELLTIDQREGRRFVTLRKTAQGVSVAELDRPEPGDERELAAASANAAYLRAQLDRMERTHGGELDELREDVNRELMRRAYAAADLDWARRGPLATLVAAEYEATTSWRLTKPLRAAGKILRRGR